MRCTRALLRSVSIRLGLLAAVLLLPSCSVWFFSGETWRDQSRPVALVETTGGIEFAATTEYGILTLGRSATTGPCRVHYFVGPTPLIESGELAGTGSLFTQAKIDLKTQLIRVLDRSPTTDDELRVMWTPDGQTVQTVGVRVASGDGLAGDLIEDPGTDLPAGATLLCRGPDGRGLFAGLVAGRATIKTGDGAGRYYVIAGVDRVREMLAVPTQHPVDYVPKYRTDDISVMQAAKPKPEPATTTPPDGGGGNPPR